jgi:predicted DNA-binding protein with PD1-like motif
MQCVASVGERDGEPFVHCHGSWRTTEGLRMGHMLAANCIVTEPVEASGFGFVDATFRAIPDAETHFTLFEPFAASPSAPTGQALLVRIRPNEDVCTAIESVCRSHRIDGARVFGIGSLNEVHFADGRRMNSHATELFVREGRVTTDEGKLQARLDIAVVDMKGNIAEGEILRGDNPVCITFELVIVPDVAIP